MSVHVYMCLCCSVCVHSTTDIQAGTGIEPCLSSYNNIASFGANSYIQICKVFQQRNFEVFIHVSLDLVNNFYAGKRFTFSLDFRTYNCNGILLYVATPLYPDHVLLELANGRVMISNHVHSSQNHPFHICSCGLYLTMDQAKS